MSGNEHEVSIESQVDTQLGRYLTFKIGDEIFGIEIRYVTEIIGLQKISRLPEMPEYIKGIINLRGLIIPVIDVRIKFKKEPIPYTDRTCVIVINTGEFPLGLIVDKVAEVMSIDFENIVQPPDAKTGVQNNYIQSIGIVDDQIILVLNCKKMIYDQDIEALKGN